MNSSTAIYAELRTKGILSASELSRALKISQPSISRGIAHLNKQKLLKVGKARSTKYAALRNIAALGSCWPLYRILENGNAENAGTLYSLYQRFWHLLPEPSLSLFFREDFSEGIFPDFPWLLEDQRPQGFLGRIFSRTHASELGINRDSRMWTADELLIALLHYGSDMPGNLILGTKNLEKFHQELLSPPSSIESTARETIYPRLAEAALHGDTVGSSAGGEQPKFTALIHDLPDSHRHVIVKFSPTTNTAAGKRWADLLTCEHLALTVLQKNKIPTTSSSLLSSENRVFLELTRFDRHGRHGRSGLFSLASFDAAYFGEVNTPWTALAERLVANHWISPEDGQTLRLLWWFGTLIGNNDMHYGNISLLQTASGSLSLAPAYDILPMLYAPAANGEIIQRPFRPPPPPPEEKGIWLEAATYAEEFWSLTQEQPNLDATFKSFAVENLRMISQLRTL